MAKIDKARFWTGVLYPENMREDWKEVIGDTLQYPYAYCQHSQDKDSKSEHRKDHVHLIVAFPNTTTYKHALNVMDLLSAEGKKAINKCEAVVGIRNVYDYLIHDTEDCRKKAKSSTTRPSVLRATTSTLVRMSSLAQPRRTKCSWRWDKLSKHGFTNYMDFYEFVVDTYEDMNYIEVMRCYSGHFERMTRGNYQRWEQGQRGLRPSQAKLHENSTNTTPDCCPACGSVDIVKSGKTLANTQRWACKDCGKRFV